MRFNSQKQGTPKPMEVWSADLPFENRDGSKDRPIVILGRSGQSYDAMISTTHPHQDSASYMRPLDPYDAGLDSRSYIRTDKIYKIPSSSLNYLIGDLGEDDSEVLKVKYDRMKRGGHGQDRSGSRDSLRRI